MSDISTNRKAHRDYKITDTFEAGIVLKGTEVKSLRLGRCNLDGAFARIENAEAWLYQLDISPYEQAHQFNHEPKATRRLLLHKSEIQKLFGMASIKGRALPALKMYWKSGKVKVLIGVGTGKNHGDKREDMKKADAKREIDRFMKNKDR